ncbi:DUF6776 family protein [Alteromonas sp. ASW11-130]|uniref:DUF6776 family protein n=1 Tax=Alteromonas sp. ASW11-130 TaxID=3015775 RepID=UPI0022429432|nr:DUF6776 family protein [Alteromonas sp. ASW11-130]MCW8091715.1 hypothetical protein [Alteromonas sp. ASW11-130]
MKITNDKDSGPVIPAKRSIAIAMLIMMAFGYFLAHYFAEEQVRVASATKRAIESFAEENNQLTTKTHQLQAELTLLQEENEQLIATVEKYQVEQSELLDTLSLYERIIAPETTQKGFALEQLKITEAAGKNRYRMAFILLQKHQNKAVVKGNLKITIKGRQSGKPAIVATGSEHLLAEGEMFYRFKFFQAEQMHFTLPEDFTPEFVEVETDVYQYTTLRGKYQKQFAWNSVFDN